MTDLPPPIPNPQPPANRLSAAPPPIPAAPLGYAGPMPAPHRTKPPFAVQAAKASWVAPLVALVIGFLDSQSTRGHQNFSDHSGNMVVGVVNCILILAGFILGVIALCGIRRHGRGAILAPAIVGIALNGFLLALAASAFFLLPHFRQAAAARQAALRQTVTAQEANDSIAKLPGWVGQASRNGAAILALTIPSDTLLSKDIKSSFGSDFLCISLMISNANGSGPLTVNASDVSVVLKDGAAHPALPPEGVFAAAPANGPQLRSDYPPTVTLPAGAAKQGTVAAFLPADVDPAQIDHVIVLIDATPLTVAGKFMTAEEKAKVLIPATPR